MTAAEHSSWTFLSNHAQALIAIADDPDVRIRDIAERIGITERATQSIVNDLVEAGYVSRRRVGRRNTYTVDVSRPMRHSAIAHNHVGALLASLVPWKQGDAPAEPWPAAAPRTPAKLAAVPPALPFETRVALDKLSGLARTLLDAPLCLIGSVGDDDTVFGHEQPGTCAPVIAEIRRRAEAGSGPLIVPDMQECEPLRETAAARPDLRGLAGLPLLTTTGGLIGIFCVADTRPRVWSEVNVRLLTSLAAAAAAQIEVGIVSERHQASAQRYRALLDSMPETVILVLDEQLRFQVASGQALTRSGYDPRSLIGKRMADTVPEESRWALAHYQAGLRGHHHEFTITNAAGITFTVEIVPVRDRDGQVRSVMGLLREAAQAA